MSTPQLETSPVRAETAPQERGRRPVLLVAAVAVFVAAVWFTGRHLTRTGTNLSLAGGYLLVGRFAVVLTPRVLLPLGVATAIVVWGPALAARLRWQPLLVIAAAGSALWAVTLALSSGWDRLVAPLLSRHDYLHDVPRVRGLGTLLSTFVDHVPVTAADHWTTHVAGHPPGALLTFVLLDRIGLSGPGWAAALCIAGGSLAVAAVLITVRAVADETAARTVAPFAVLVPAAVWIATSADAFFAGVSACGVAALATAARRRRGPAADVRALAGGLLLGGSLFLSFGLVAAGLIALTVVVVQRRRIGWVAVLRVLAIAGIGVTVVFAVFRLGGYDWFSALPVDAQRVRDGAAYAGRPGEYFLFADVAAGAVAAGPAVVAGLAGLRRGALRWLPLAALGAMAVSVSSGLVLGETERIWLPFVVWLLPATATIPDSRRQPWLVAAAVVGLLVEITVRTPW
ncbi:hypothetical protein [Petropleomorpha daqingensis]|uniref:Integral membrane protein n=1 Tax=Petropleomorpha daqingensis TaxID=2026353 RepID=A0A853CL04_9ACTN|nr:hypothetical protein [Petropleomorpha daqingensis]NYJ07222.1 hypothetical protein [Petropleomorpha daqingensis]